MRFSMLLIVFFVGTHTLKISAQEKSDTFQSQEKKEKFPIPKEENQLFYLQRDPNINTVIYTLNIKEGEIDESHPVNAHWIRYAEEGQRTNLSFIQRKMAYGVHHKKLDENEYDIRIQAYKDLRIRLRFNPKKDTYQAFTKIEDKEFVLEKIFVRITGGSLFNPDVEYIEVSGYDPLSKKKISHRFLP